MRAITRFKWRLSTTFSTFSPGLRSLSESYGPSSSLGTPRSCAELEPPLKKTPKMQYSMRGPPNFDGVLRRPIRNRVRTILPRNFPLKVRRMRQRSLRYSDRSAGGAIASVRPPRRTCSMASPKRRETSAGPTASISVWHWFHRRDRRDTACCIGRMSELRTSLTSPIISTRMHLAGETQALTWPKWQQPQGIARSRKRRSGRPKHDQSQGEVLQFPPDHSVGSRKVYQRERRAALFCQTRCAVLRSTDFPIHLGVRPY